MNILGAIFSELDVRDYRAVCPINKRIFPKSFELPMVRIKNQKSVCSCVAHALSTVVEYYNYIQNKSKVEMSVGYIYGNRNLSSYKKKGMIVRDALATLKLYGNVPKEDFPDNIEVPMAINKFNQLADDLYDKGYPNRISSYYRLKTANDIKAVLQSKNPVVMAMKWYSDMKVVDGVLTTKHKNYTGGHCMIIYGWNEKGWKVQNSWGKSWGNNGTCIIPYNMKIEEAWGVGDNITDNMAIKKPFSSDAGKSIAKVLNTLGNAMRIK